MSENLDVCMFCYFCITKLVLLYVKSATNQRLGKLRSIYLIDAALPLLHLTSIAMFSMRSGEVVEGFLSINSVTFLKGGLLVKGCI